MKFFSIFKSSAGFKQGIIVCLESLASRLTKSKNGYFHPENVYRKEPKAKCCSSLYAVDFCVMFKYHFTILIFHNWGKIFMFEKPE